MSEEVATNKTTAGKKPNFVSIFIILLVLAISIAFAIFFAATL